MLAVKSFSGGILSTYIYDEEGRRISTTVDGVTTNYHYDQGINVLFEGYVLKIVAIEKDPFGSLLFRLMHHIAENNLSGILMVLEKRQRH